MHSTESQGGHGDPPQRVERRFENPFVDPRVEHLARVLEETFTGKSLLAIRRGSYRERAREVIEELDREDPLLPELVGALRRLTTLLDEYGDPALTEGVLPSVRALLWAVRDIVPDAAGES